MRAFLAPVIAAASLAAFPVLAQSTTPSAQSNTSATAQNTAPSANQMEQKLQKDLSKAGYTDIHIVPGSFLVSAKDSEGQQTQMMISPHSMVEMTAVPQKSGSGNSGSSSNSKPSKN